MIHSVIGGKNVKVSVWVGTTDTVGLSEQYFGLWTPQKVKDRVTEVLYGWTLWLKEEPKIQEAYSMLKKQGEGMQRPRKHQHLTPSGLKVAPEVVRKAPNPAT